MTMAKNEPSQDEPQVLASTIATGLSHEQISHVAEAVTTRFPDRSG